MATQILFSLSSCVQPIVNLLRVFRGLCKNRVFCDFQFPWTFWSMWTVLSGLFGIKLVTRLPPAKPPPPPKKIANLKRARFFFVLVGEGPTCSQQGAVILQGSPHVLSKIAGTPSYGALLSLLLSLSRVGVWVQSVFWPEALRTLQDVVATWTHLPSFLFNFVCHCSFRVCLFYLRTDMPTYPPWKEFIFSESETHTNSKKFVSPTKDIHMQSEQGESETLACQRAQPNNAQGQRNNPKGVKHGRRHKNNFHWNIASQTRLAPSFPNVAS